MSLEELRERIKAEGLYDADYTGESNDHIADAGRMPWDNQPTPLANQSAVEEYSPRLKMYVDLQTARGLERRMRAAERLLEDIKFTFRGCHMPLIDAHLEAARNEDGQ